LRAHQRLTAAVHRTSRALARRQLLGLDGTSALVREGLRLVHKRARELAMAKEYDRFYGGEPAPVPEGVAAIWNE
jgi:hypothetical protein